MDTHSSIHSLPYLISSELMFSLLFLIHFDFSPFSLRLNLSNDQLNILFEDKEI